MYPHTTPASVLLVDDHPDVLLLWRIVLRAAGMFGSIDEATDGETAVRRLKRSCPDVVVTDYAMPGSSGLAVVETARGARDDVIVVMTSNSYDIREQALCHGASAFMNKYESTTERLPAVLQRLLEEARPDAAGPQRVCV